MMKTRERTIREREDIYHAVGQTMNAIIRGDECELLLFNCWGPRGSGKTHILNELKSRIIGLDNVKVFGPFDMSALTPAFLEEIASELNASSKQDIKLILFDNMETITSTSQDDSIIYDVEQKIIGPLIANRNSIIVITSLHEINQWSSVEVRIRHKSILIPQVDGDFIRTSAKKSGLKFTIALRKKTAGHPKLLEWLAENPALDEEKLDTRATDFFLDGLKSETKQIARAISLSISFGVPAYQQMVNVLKLRPENSYFGDLKRIKEIAALGLIYYDSNSGMYHFSDPIQRELLARSFHRDFPEYTVKIYSMLADEAMNECQFASSMPSHLLNAIYYQLSTSKIDEVTFLQWLDSWFGSDIWSNIDREKLNYEIMKNPSSKYLHHELKKLAGTQLYKSIIEKIRPSGDLQK